MKVPNARKLALLLAFVGIGLACVTPSAERAWAQEEPAFSGLDESVNEALAEEARLPSRDPFINTEAMGELWSLLLLAGGGICGFIIGRYWDLIWGKSNETPKT
jgi:hypothetical protein